MVFWFTGISGSGKTTLGKKLERYLTAQDKKCYCTDGDEMGHDLGRGK